MKWKSQQEIEVIWKNKQIEIKELQKYNDRLKIQNMG